MTRSPARGPLALLSGLAVAVASGGAVLLLLQPWRSATAPGRAGSALTSPADRRPFAFAGPTLRGPPRRVDSSRLRGRPVLLELWASWCPSCRSEAPMLARLAASFRNDVRFVGVDVNDRRRDGLRFVRAYGLAFPHIFDPKARLARRLGVFGIPTFFLVDVRGRLAARLIGRQRESDLARLLGRLAAERTAAGASSGRGA